MSRNWLKFSRGTVPVVDVRIGPDRYRALVDTGAQICFISPELKLDLGLPLIGTQNIIGVTGQRESLPVVLLSVVGFAEVQLVSCPAVVRNLKPLGLSIELILGVNAFANHRLQFDFREGRIYIVE